jgi:hypothetical protein
MAVVVDFIVVVLGVFACVVVVFVVVDSVDVFVGVVVGGGNSVNVRGGLGEKCYRNLLVKHMHKLESHIIEHNFENKPNFNLDMKQEPVEPGDDPREGFGHRKV